MDIQSAREAIELPSRIIFLCASTMESARILFNSATREFPDGLANSSGQLGRNLMDHVYQVGASGTLDGNEDKMPMGNRPNGIYMPRFRNVTEKHPEFLRGYGCQGGGHRDGWDPGFTMADFGAHFKHTLRRPAPWKFGSGGFAECLPHPDNRVLIDKGKPDAWGVPTLRISCTWRRGHSRDGKRAWATIRRQRCSMRIIFLSPMVRVWRRRRVRIRR